MLESWLLFQRGRAKEAAELLHEAEAALAGTDDYLTLGNIYSSYGRIARRQRRYDQAILCFTRAIHEYRKRDPGHRNLARTLVNIAIVERYIGLQLRDNVDATMRRRREASARGEHKAPPRGVQLRQQLEQLRHDALAHLAEAERIYLENSNNHGSGSVYLARGYLHLDHGEFDRAADEAGRAFQLAEEKSDTIAMARARLLECMIGNAKLEEELGDGDGAVSHTRHALELAREAVAFAAHTQNRRLLAKTLLWQGLTESSGALGDLGAAQHSYESAMAALKGDDPGNLSADFDALRGRLFRTGSVDPLLRAWTQGLVGSKTFQQVLEEFSDLVVPRVWEREGRKIARVAQRLSMSPKKVRRIVSRAGVATAAVESSCKCDSDARPDKRPIAVEECPSSDLKRPPGKRSR